MNAPDNRDSGGSLPRPFVGGESSVAPAAPQSYAGISRPFVPGQETQPAGEPALPPITEFLYEERVAGRAPSFTPSAPPIPGYTTPSSGAPAIASGAATPPEPWATGEWQSYDWRAAAALAPDDSSRAQEAWSDLDWDSDARHVSRDRAATVAAALERVARQIRAGDLPVRGHTGMTDEAAVAAALAALLAMKR